MERHVSLKISRREADLGLPLKFHKNQMEVPRGGFVELTKKKKIMTKAFFRFKR